MIYLKNIIKASRLLKSIKCSSSQRLTTPLIKLDFKLEKSALDEIKPEYELPASTPLNFLTSRAIKHGFIGWNCFTGIPEALGGAIFRMQGQVRGKSPQLFLLKILRVGLVEEVSVFQQISAIEKIIF